MKKILKSFIFIVPLSFVLLSHTSTTSDNNIARGGGGGGHGGTGFSGHGIDAGRGGFDHGADRNWNNNYNGYGGYGGGVYHNGGYNGYGPVLLPDSTQDPNDDMNQMYQQNLRNMEKTGE